MNVRAWSEAVHPGSSPLPALCTSILDFLHTQYGKRASLVHFYVSMQRSEGES